MQLAITKINVGFNSGVRQAFLGLSEAKSATTYIRIAGLWDGAP